MKWDMVPVLDFTVAPKNCENYLTITARGKEDIPDTAVFSISETTKLVSWLVSHATVGVVRCTLRLCSKGQLEEQ